MEAFVTEATELLTCIAKALVDDKAKVDVKTVSGDKLFVFEVGSDKTDVGKLIGKQGRNADAIRTILNAVSAKFRCRAIVQFND